MNQKQGVETIGRIGANIRAFVAAKVAAGVYRDWCRAWGIDEPNGLRDFATGRQNNFPLRYLDRVIEAMRADGVDWFD